MAFSEKRKHHKRKKKVANIVSFDEDDVTTSSSPGSSITSPSASSTRSFDLAAHPIKAAGRKKEGFSLARQGSAGALLSGSLPSDAAGFLGRNDKTSSSKTHARNSSMGSLALEKEVSAEGAVGGIVLPSPDAAGLSITASSSLPAAASSVSKETSHKVPIGSEGASNISVLHTRVGVRNQTENTQSDTLPGTSRQDNSPKDYAFSSGYATQSSDSSQDLPPGRVTSVAGALDKLIDTDADSAAVVRAHSDHILSLRGADDDAATKRDMFHSSSRSRVKDSFGLKQLDTGSLIR